MNRNETDYGRQLFMPELAGRKISLCKMSMLRLRRTIAKSPAIVLIAIAVVLGCGQAATNRAEMLNILAELGSTNSAAVQKDAVERLQRLGTNAFPFLIAEMDSFKWHTPQEQDQSIIDRTRRLQRAFNVLGTNLIPLTNEFVSSLNTNRNFVSALNGLAAMGNQGIPYLILALTNGNADVRFAAVGGVLQVARKSPEEAKGAIRGLIPLLQDESALVRSLAANVLGLYCVEPHACIPALLQAALTDSNEVVRCQAVKAVGSIRMRTRRMELPTRRILEEISKQDKSHFVRETAEQVIEQEDAYRWTNKSAIPVNP